ncbi:MAG: BamA/TamA family outer membrane protein [Bacteroidetes bacterium]|nr:BamA/TamA family outer membrane protein [Bacteroidota bacterium]
MKSKITLILFFLLIICLSGFSQQDSSKQVVKKGWKLGALPVVAYDADLGFQYGVLGQLNDFGDGSNYPDYRHMIYVEWSRFTKGTGVNQIFYDTKTLLPKHIRMTVDLSYLTEKALDFFGFNGYEAAYIHDFENDDSPDYISRVYYKHERKQLRALLDFQGRITSQRFRWLGGISYYNFKVDTVDIGNLNKGKSEDEKLPDTTLLYDKYVQWGFIDEKEKDGGQTIFLKGGLIYDTRDNEPAPNRGVWEEVVIMTAPSFIGNSEFAFTRLAITHRHYIPLIKDKMTLAYRLSYQGTIGGKAPFYIEPLLMSSFSTATNNDGLGGAKSLRGIKRDRVVGDGTVMANVELRYKIIKTTLLKQNFYIAVNAFGDMGQVVQYRDIDKLKLPSTETYSDYFDQSRDNIHFGYGAGLRLVLNDNFILAIDYGFASDSRDGTSGLYINIGNLY